MTVPTPVRIPEIGEYPWQFPFLADMAGVVNWLLERTWAQTLPPVCDDLIPRRKP